MLVDDSTHPRTSYGMLYYDLHVIWILMTSKTSPTPLIIDILK